MPRIQSMGEVARGRLERAALAYDAAVAAFMDADHFKIGAEQSEKLFQATEKAQEDLTFAAIDFAQFCDMQIVHYGRLSDRLEPQG